MILIKGRQMLIPEEERYIGTTYDSHSEYRIFCIDRAGISGTDLSSCLFKLDLQYENGDKDTSIVNKQVESDRILLTWEIENSILQQPGTVFISLRAFDESGTVKWATFRAVVYVEDTINTPGTYSGSLTEMEQLEKRLEDAETLAQEMAEAEKERKANEEYRQEKLEELENDLLDARLAESWAVGGTGLRDDEDKNNSKYYCAGAKKSAETADEMARKASIYARGLTNRGIYDQNEVYDQNDFVYYLGSTWIALQDGINGISPSENSYWNCLAKGTEKIEMDKIYANDTYGLIGEEDAEVLASDLLDAITEETLNARKLYGIYYVSLPESGWENYGSNMYIQTVTVAGMTEADNPILVSALDDGATEATQKDYVKAFGIVASGTATTAENSVTFKVYRKPATDIVVGLKGV